MIFFGPFPSPENHINKTTSTFPLVFWNSNIPSFIISIPQKWMPFTVYQLCHFTCWLQHQIFGTWHISCCHVKVHKNIYSYCQNHMLGSPNTRKICSPHYFTIVVPLVIMLLISRILATVVIISAKSLPCPFMSIQEFHLRRAALILGLVSY